ncbi:MAG: ATP-binding protein [Turicibacter sp.]|nr:ATP-binding protein [Turicibacter sp.]
MMKRLFTSLIFINLLISNFVIFHFNFFDLEHYLTRILFCILLLIIGVSVYLIEPNQETTRSFSLLLHLAFWTLLTLQSNDLIFLIIGRILLSFVPLVIFSFLSQVNHLTTKKEYRQSFVFLFIISIISVPMLTSFTPALQRVIFIHFILSFFAIGRLNISRNFLQRPSISKSQVILLSIFILSFLPFLLSHTLFRHVGYGLRILSIYSFISLPLAIAYSLIKQNKLNISFDFETILYKCCLYGTFLILSSMTFFLVLGGSVVSYNFLLISFVIFSYFRDEIGVYYENKRIKHLSLSKKKLDDERMGILQNINYDNYLSSLGKVIKNLIAETVDTNGNMIIWLENDRPYIFEQSGIFSNYKPSQDFTKNLGINLCMFNIQQKGYFCFPLIYKQKIRGWLVIGERASAHKFTPVEIDQILNLAAVIAEVICLSELLNTSQFQYIPLKKIAYDDYINYQILNANEDFRRKIAHYLHDDILQSVLTSFNFLSGMNTEQIKQKEMTLKILTELIHSLRDKMFDIYPSSLEHLGLYRSLEMLCKKSRENLNDENRRIFLNIEEGDDIPDYLHFSVFRIVRELLQNAVKHSQATEITIDLASDKESIFVHILDNGIGFDVEEQLGKDDPTTIGLLSVQQDIASLFGNTLIRSNPKTGTSIQITIPVHAN